ncbi:hypothetical protein M408DRAFT_83183 [Serendipita vermifera MAFF 305830]|uniref:CHAT domain-containing protein n=1 Tax=Serendipita vermifera MAFF 305830 TaxID=933852 RepID=A0A0C3AHY8_SERVB|nr:hypothetical protein M408DRAFT_83183 [Serendipita vermifera MAFF 305830]
MKFSVGVSPSPIYNATKNIVNGSRTNGEIIASRERLESDYVEVQRLENRNIRAQELNKIGCAYNKLYQQSLESADLERAIAIHEEAKRYTSLSDPLFAKCSNDLGLGLKTRFGLTMNRMDIDRAVTICEKTVEITNDNDPKLLNWLHTLGHCYMARISQFGGEDDQNQAISIWKRMVKLARDDDPNKHAFMGNLGISLHTRFEQSGSLSDLSEAILTFRDAVNLLSAGHVAKPSLMKALGVTLHSRFTRHGDLKDLEEALSCQQAAVDLTSNGHPDKADILTNLGNSLLSRFEHFRSISDLNTAISHFQAANITPDNGPKRPDHIGNLGNAILLRFKHLGSVEDLKYAISLYQLAVDLTPNGHLDKPALIINLGKSIRLRFKRLGDVQDLDNAISIDQEAANLMPDHHPLRLHAHPEKLALMVNLAISTQVRFEYFGDLKDLDQAILFGQAAADRMPDGHPQRAYNSNNLGVSNRLRFERLGDIKDLEKAISLFQVAVDSTPDGHPDKPRCLCNLGVSFTARFGRLGDVQDLENGISFVEAAVGSMPDSHPEKPGQLSELGYAIELRFKRLGNSEDLEKAILLKQAAVDRMPDSHHFKPNLLNNLGSSMQSRFEHLGDIEDLKKAVSFFQAAVDLTPDDQRDKSFSLSNLGNSCELLFQKRGDVNDLERAISFKRAAVNLTPNGHFDKPRWLGNLGNAFSLRFRETSELSDLKNALSSLSTAATSPTGPSTIRFEAACQWADISYRLNQPPIAAFDCAINLLPQLAWLGMSLRDQHIQIARAGSLVRYAVAVAIELQEYETAVQWAEYGRSIVWQNLLSLRSPLDELRKSHSKLAMRLQDISQQLEMSLSYPNLPDKKTLVPLLEAANKASALAAERDKIIEQIRTLPGFEHFFKARTFDKLAPAAYEGPVAIINTYDFRSDALILIPHDSQTPTVSVVHIPLESFSNNMSISMFHDFTRLLSSAGVRARDSRKSERTSCVSNGGDSFKNILSHLWLHVVKPILEGLAYQVSLPIYWSHSLPGDNTRIWWCATGMLAFLPIHAAGNYDSDAIGEKISDYVVSSYTPTLTAIIDQSQPSMTMDSQILTIAQPSTPGATPLPETENEVQKVKDIATGIRVKQLINGEATAARVLQAMKESNWIHLACHGMQDNKEPLKSGFLLHDKTLELSELIREPLPKTDFAFLSACQTATGDVKITEESVHLAAGMLFSGCRGVIGTMWSIQDEDAPKVTEAVYRWMLKDGMPNRKEAARALHEAVRELRESGTNFLSWVPFIHMGR